MNLPAHADDGDGGLPPPGQRWGAGASSVLPYLTKSLQAKPASVDARDNRDGRPQPDSGHPVFANWPPQPPAR